ncbi:hypothetical protein JCM4814A_03630 [Streptomyces phaeofaciens JCM 4814]|uniref:Tn3 transposase DDE domain-containing protein n=1 Tax=Streptomyces phaeofaciens TaxID=68254 RepID=A0A918HR49_9ACTN|nr:Tn3 family transposase [Streptomyces phaeofaciens]GGT97538.1 hypothetical protein GCM10010226_88680 [Streptomyces phaeofaciens]
MSDAAGLSLHVALSAANSHDSRALKPMLAHFPVTQQSEFSRLQAIRLPAEGRAGGDPQAAAGAGEADDRHLPDGGGADRPRRPRATGPDGAPAPFPAGKCPSSGGAAACRPAGRGAGEAHWRDLRRVSIAIREGILASPLLLRRLGSSSKRNQIYRASRAVGRAVATVQMLRFISDSSLCRRVTQRPPNKVESFNNFTDWLAFCNGGVIADNDPVEQEKAVK